MRSSMPLEGINFVDTDEFQCFACAVGGTGAVHHFDAVMDTMVLL